MSKLSDDAVHRNLDSLPGWELDGEMIARTYEHPDFRTAMAFVNFVAEVAENHGHHPDVDVRYDQVRLAVVTHDAGGLTDKDFNLARAIDHV